MPSGPTASMTASSESEVLNRMKAALVRLPLRSFAADGHDCIMVRKPTLLSAVGTAEECHFRTSCTAANHAKLAPASNTCSERK